MHTLCDTEHGAPAQALGQVAADTLWGRIEDGCNVSQRRKPPLTNVNNVFSCCPLNKVEQMVQPLCDGSLAQPHYLCCALLPLLKGRSQYENSMGFRVQVDPP